MLIVLSLKDFGLVFQDRDLVKTLRHSTVVKKKKKKKKSRRFLQIGGEN